MPGHVLRSGADRHLAVEHDNTHLQRRVRKQAPQRE
jgi:hypothetical protein